MNKIIIAVLALIGAVVIGAFGWRYFFTGPAAPSEIACPLDAKLCPDGTAVGRSGPRCEFAPCPEISESGNAEIRVTAPRAGSVIASPVRVTGRARGGWYFEASFPIVIVDADGRELGRGVAQAQGDWMTAEFVPFVADIVFSQPTTPEGEIILRKDNPFGLPENAAEFALPVRFGGVR